MAWKNLVHIRIDSKYTYIMACIVTYIVTIRDDSQIIPESDIFKNEQQSS